MGEATVSCPTEVEEYRFKQAVIDNFAPIQDQKYWEGTIDSINTWIDRLMHIGRGIDKGECELAYFIWWYDIYHNIILMLS